MLLKLVDGAITNIKSDTWGSRGCETCDYGSSYVNEFEIWLDTMDITITVDSMYDQFLSEGFMMKLMLNNVDLIKAMTEEQFSIWIKEKISLEELEQEDDYDTWGSLERVEVKINKYNFEGEN